MPLETVGRLAVGSPPTPSTTRNDTMSSTHENTIREAKETRDDLAAAVADKLPIKSKLANLVLLTVNCIFFIVGVAFAMGSSALLSVADQFYGNDVFKFQLVIGLRLGLAVGLFLVVLALLGCLATCRVSACGLALYTSLLGLAILLQIGSVIILFLFGSSIASMQIGAPSFRYQNGTIKREWHTRSAVVIEHEAVMSFLNDTYIDCCVVKDVNTKHCELALRLAGTCEGVTSKQWRRSLKHAIASYAAPTAFAMCGFLVMELFVLIVACCVMWRICSMSTTKYKVEKGFSKIEMV